MPEPNTRRAKRRKAWKKRVYLNEYAVKLICRNYRWASTTWGGTRCHLCGLKVEPRYYLGNFFDYPLAGGGHIWGCEPPCDRVDFCPGENPDWEDKIPESS